MELLHVDYRLKKSYPIDLYQTFQTFILTNNDEETWKCVEKDFREMSSLRHELEFKKIQHDIRESKSACEKYESSIIRYIQHCNLVHEYFNFDIKHPKHITLPFPWTNTFNQYKTTAFSDIHTEIAAMMYNLAIIYYTDGLHQLKQSKLTGTKFSTEKFEKAFQCVEKMKDVTLKFTNLKNLPSDYYYGNLQILQHLIKGHGYEALFWKAEKEQKSLEIRVAYARKAYETFFALEDMVKQHENSCKQEESRTLPHFLTDDITQKVPIHTAVYGFYYHYYLAEYYDNSKNTDSAKLGYRYRRKALDCWESLPFLKIEILDKNPEFYQLVQKTSAKINSYSNGIAATDDHEPVRLGDDKINTIFETNLSLVLELDAFPPNIDRTNYLPVSIKINELTQEMVSYFNTGRENLDSKVQIQKYNMQSLYRKHFINFLSHYPTNTEKEDPRFLHPDLRDRIINFRAKEKQLDEFSAHLETQVKQVYKLLETIEREAEEEFKLSMESPIRKSVTNETIRSLGEDDPQLDKYRAQFLEFQSHLKQATESNNKLNQTLWGLQMNEHPAKRKKLMAHFLLTDNFEQELLQVLPRRRDQVFVENNIGKLEKIKGLCIKIEDRSKEIESRAARINAFASDPKEFRRLKPKIAALYSDGVEKNAIFKKILRNKKDEISEIEDLLDKNAGDIDDLISLSNDVFADSDEDFMMQAISVEAKDYEKIIQQVEDANRLVSNYEEGIVFFKEFITRLKQFYKEVRDYCTGQRIHKDGEMVMRSERSLPGSLFYDFHTNSPFN